MGIRFVYGPHLYWKMGAYQNVRPALMKSTVLIPDEKWQYKGESAELHRYDQTIRTIDEATLNITQLVSLLNYGRKFIAFMCLMGLSVDILFTQMVHKIIHKMF